MFTLIFGFTGCSLEIGNQEKLSFRCQSNYIIDLYDVNSSINVYTQNDFISYISQKNIYSAKWEDVDVDQMYQILERDKQSMEKMNLTITYNIDRIGNDLTSNLIMEFNSNNLNNLIDNDLSTIINDSKIKEKDYKQYLKNKGYVCVDA